MVVSSTMQSTAHLISIMTYFLDLNFTLLTICACHDLFSPQVYSLDHGDGWHVIPRWLNLRFFVSGLSQLVRGLPFIYFFFVKGVFLLIHNVMSSQYKHDKPTPTYSSTRMYTANNHVYTQRTTIKH